jgi:hypothetical protein
MTIGACLVVVNHSAFCTWRRRVPLEGSLYPFSRRGSDASAASGVMVRAAGLEPARPKPRDFKSLVFTNFTTPALLRQ